MGSERYPNRGFKLTLGLGEPLLNGYATNHTERLPTSKHTSKLNCHRLTILMRHDSVSRFVNCRSPLVFFIILPSFYFTHTLTDDRLSNVFPRYGSALVA